MSRTTITQRLVTRLIKAALMMAIGKSLLRIHLRLYLSCLQARLRRKYKAYAKRISRWLDIGQGRP